MSPSRWVHFPGTGPLRDSRLTDRGDPGLVWTFAILRVLVALTILVSALFVTPHQSDTKVWLIVVAAGYLPFAVIVLLATRRRRNKWAMIVGPLGDLVMLAVAQALLHQGVGLTACYPIIAAYVAYTVPGIPTWALAGFTLALSLSVQSQLPPSQRFTISRFGLFAALVIGVLLIVERATARSRGAEERFARAKSRADAVLAAVGSAVVVTDSGSQVLTANPAADQLLDGGHSLTGQLCSAALGLHLGERRLDCSSGCQLLAATKVHRGTPDGDPQSFEAWRPGPDGSRQPVLVSVNALPTTEGPDVEVVHSIQDISRLKQADEAKTLFLATASHELKTPLTVINGYAKTLTTRSLPPDKQREALAAIRRRGVELERVVDRLLLSSRIEAGRAEVANAVVDLIPLVYERAAELATATDRQIDVALPDDLPAVTGDSSAIVTVLDHLLDNAVKYSPDGQTVTVEARTEPADQHPAHSVLLEVTDAGVGMDTQTVERCFDKFWQADASGTRRFGGTGIGLYIVRSLVEAMGGTISVRSQPGSGSTFSVRLLAAEAIPSLRQPIRDEGTASPTRRLPRVTRQPRTAEPESERVSRD